MREPFEFRRGLVVWAPLPLCTVPHTGEGSQELQCLCGDCYSVGWFVSVGCVLAVLETCIRTVFAVIVGTAIVIGVAPLLRTVAFLAHATALGIAALAVDQHQFLGGSQELLYLCRDCRSVCRFASVDGVEAVLEICSSSVFAVLGVAPLLCIAAFWRMRLLSGLPHCL